MLKTILFIITFIFYSSNVFAASGSGDQLVKKINLVSNGHIIVTLSGSVDNESCSTANHIFILKDNFVHADKAYSLLLTAQATGKKVYLNVNGCVDLWGNGVLFLNIVSVISRDY